MCSTKVLEMKFVKLICYVKINRNAEVINRLSVWFSEETNSQLIKVTVNMEVNDVDTDYSEGLDEFYLMNGE